MAERDLLAEMHSEPDGTPALYEVQTYLGSRLWTSPRFTLFESPMPSLSISKLALHALWLIPLHLTPTSASACPPKDAFDWNSVGFACFNVEDDSHLI